MRHAHVAMVEDVGFEPLFSLPKRACYRYTTSSIERRSINSFHIKRDTYMSYNYLV